MTLVRKKLSKSGWVLLSLIAIVLIALPILHFTGVFLLNFIGDWAMSVALAASTSGWLAAIVGIGCGAVGFGLCYILKDYIIGIEGNSTNLTISNSGTGYNPVPTQPATAGIGAS